MWNVCEVLSLLRLRICVIKQIPGEQNITVVYSECDFVNLSLLSCCTINGGKKYFHDRAKYSTPYFIRILKNYSKLAV